MLPTALSVVAIFKQFAVIVLSYPLSATTAVFLVTRYGFVANRAQLSAMNS